MAKIVLVVLASVVLTGCVAYHDAYMSPYHASGCHYEGNVGWVCGYDKGYSLTTEACCDYPVAYRTKMREVEVPVYQYRTHYPNYPYYPYNPYYPYYPY
ncbi:MAG: hypothetical protein HQL06_05405 [Nitrospirae bacterium]|nr:hypothetical protein [Nitrospirota bacterium]